jgi:protein-S-isoprenylcysteine O-methyltransferase Ste14
MLNRVVAWLPLAVLAAMLVVSRVRALALRRRGIRVIVVDGNRPLREVIHDALLVAVFVFWSYLLVAEAWPLSLAWLPDGLSTKLIAARPLKIVGAALLIAAPLLFAAAVTSLGVSWRMGVDRQAPGPLVTTGLFAWARNPIYVAFDVLYLAAFLCHGRVIYLLLAVAMWVLLDGVIRREERFLADRFGDEFRVYCQRVGRYSPWL